MGAALACGSGKGSPPAASNPCDDYFDAIVTSACGTGPSLPADEMSRVRTRFEVICAGFATLPGSGMTDAQLAACVSATQAAGCVAPGALPSACSVPGSLPDGAACNEPFQCAGGQCFVGASAGPDASTGTASLCGVCATLPAVGQPCTGSCAAGAACDHTQATPTCVSVTAGAAGDPCDGIGADCGAGLYCDAVSGACAQLPVAGEPCTDTGLCAVPAWCLAKNCAAPGSSGAPCGTDAECQAGLGCSVQTETCGTVTWAAAGDPCGDLARCLVGVCNPGPSTCPAVLGDGASCDPADQSTTCDTLAGCVGGTCQSVDATVCQ